MQELIPYLILINAAELFLMHHDKRQAQKHRWRIPEAVLMLLCLFGGSIGGILGMVLFRHKTRKTKFFIGMPAILLFHIFLFFRFT